MSLTAAERLFSPRPYVQCGVKAVVEQWERKDG